MPGVVHQDRRLRGALRWVALSIAVIPPGWPHHLALGVSDPPEARLARAFAQRLIALRDRLAPHVLLAGQLSVWGTDEGVGGFTHRTHTAVVLWQLPLGDTTLNDTWGHYRDNRLHWWPGAGGPAHGLS